MKKTYKNKEEVEAVLKEILWLAWNAVGRPSGMGVFQNKPGATKEDVWNNTIGMGDYPMPTSREGRLYADYVFGRMMKLSVDYGDTWIDVPEHTPRSDYQAWCTKYPTYESLWEAAEKNLKSD